MIKLYFNFICLCLINSAVLAIRKNNNTNYTGTSLLDKQNDYKLDFERVEVVRYNKEYLKYYNVVTFKYNRTCAVSNWTIEYKVDIGYDHDIIVQAYRFASNEYRTFPIRMQFNYCEAIIKNIMGFGELIKCGNSAGCPVIKGTVYKFYNWAPNPAKFPPLIPNGQYMLEMQGLYHSTELYVLRGYGTISRPIATP